MKWSQAFIYTMKESPAEAEIPSHKLLIRGGYIKKLAAGIFTYGPLALRSIRKFEQIVREEHEKGGLSEILMPMVQPRELWEETGRWSQMGDGLLKFRNRNKHEFCLGATHEEAVTDFVRKDLKSYRDLPVKVFQIQTKFRDEIRPRFGLLRGREFIMKDAYSFDLFEESAKQSYELMYQVYLSIFQRLGVEFRVVQADTGNIGGSLSHEFQILAESGEDQLMVSTEGDFAANIEVCPAFDNEAAGDSEEVVLERELFATPGLKSIADLSRLPGIEESKLVKTLFFSVGPEDSAELKPIAVLLRGKDEANPIKIKNLLKLANPPQMLTDEQVLKVSGASAGSCGPVGLQIPIYMDHGVQALRNFIVGANVEGQHLKNVNHGRDFSVTQVADLRMAKDGDRSPEGGGVLRSIRGIEAGHIFYLGTKYSKAMNLNYLAGDGKLEPVQMGCYGIGISRTIQAVIEQNHDKDGVIWPVSIAPFHVHICHLDVNDVKATEVAESVYAELLKGGVEVLFDDRDERPGVKFKDADLLGMPLRLTIGSRGLVSGELELLDRRTKSVTKLKLDEVNSFIKAWLRERGWAHV